MPSDGSGGTRSFVHWLRAAKSDLVLAGLGTSDDILPELRCFHAQQAVEKSFKSVLAYLDAPVPRTHNIETIIEMLAQYVEIPIEIREFDELTLYAVGTRYPSNYESVSENEYRDALAKAGQALLWAESICTPRDI